MLGTWCISFFVINSLNLLLFHPLDVSWDDLDDFDFSSDLSSEQSSAVHGAKYMPRTQVDYLFIRRTGTKNVIDSHLLYIYGACLPVFYSVYRTE